MEQLKILIADDEQGARDLVVHYLHQSTYSFQVIHAADGKTALDLLSNETPDILFLDIKMPEKSGIDVLRHREIGPLPAIIFTTAFEAYALPAFEFEAVDYLLKPFSKERFDKALDKAVRYIRAFKNAVKKPHLEQISIKKGNRTQLTPVTDIHYFHAEGAYVEVHTAHGQALISTALYELEADLDPLQFIRIHKSLIVAVTHIKAIQSLPAGDFMLIMKDGTELRGSRTYRNKLKKVLHV